MIKVGISGCLGFFKCRYDGDMCGDFDHNAVMDFLKNEFETDKIILMPVCPEQLGGLPTPRVQAEIIDGDGFDVWLNKARVINKNGEDVTAHFKRGANQILHFARKSGIKAFILKENSPSCGVKQIYSGEFDGVKKQGKGVTSALLEVSNIRIYSDENISGINSKEV
ncbi:MAG: protein of unknown function DUF523 [uncultured bacterium]|nr:MAG: protein of unknown function DUF523 [uncultured bacterium]